MLRKQAGKRSQRRVYKEAASAPKRRKKIARMNIMKKEKQKAENKKRKEKQTEKRKRKKMYNQTTMTSANGLKTSFRTSSGKDYQEMGLCKSNKHKPIPWMTWFLHHHKVHSGSKVLFCKGKGKLMTTGVT